MVKFSTSPNGPLLIIVVAQLFGTSLWFSPSSAADDLIRAWSLSPSQLGLITSSVQVGFILGTLFLASSGYADRFKASSIFAISCFLGAVFNAAFAIAPVTFDQALILRMLVGMCLAGIYPLGMKLVIAWSKDGAGSSLGLLVGMLTLGTSLPYAVRAAGTSLSWQGVVLCSSLLAVIGGFAIHFLGEGPYLHKAAVRKKRDWGQSLRVFKDPSFRACALGYFGHMWELYAFWTLVPFLVRTALQSSDLPVDSRQTSIWAFLVIAVGALGCVLGGKLSKRFGSARVAAFSLATSGLVCLIYPFASRSGLYVSLILLLIWGFAVIADSAQFSAMAAKLCPPDALGSALAIQNSIGFFITVISISLVSSNLDRFGIAVVFLLLPGPLVGLFFFRSLLSSKAIAGQKN